MSNHTLERIRKKIVITAPVFNEEKIINDFILEISGVVTPLSDRYQFELLLVNDGSTDRTLEILKKQLVPFDIRVINLARNFGHPAACSACLKFADGDAVVLMDSDLQDDPAAIQKFIAKWEQGDDVVYAVRENRKENFVRRFMFYGFYRLFKLIADVNVPLDSGNYSLLDKKIVEHINSIPQKNGYLPGMRAYLGYRQTGISVARRNRYDNCSRVGLRGLFRLAFNAFFSFSYVPIRLFNIIGSAALFLAFVITVYALINKFVLQTTIQAWTSQIITTSFFGGINLLGIGIIGEYVARLGDQIKGYPEFTLDSEIMIQGENSQQIPIKIHQEYQSKIA
jgi:dolichol-phosphate mannosyltransferase